MKRLSVFDVKPGMILAKMVCSRDGNNLLKQGMKLTSTHINNLLEYGIPIVYIQQPDMFAQCHEVEEYRKIEETPDVINFETRHEAEKAIRDIMVDVKLGQLFDTYPAKQIVKKMAEEIMANKNVIAKLSDIRVLDDYTFAHSVNVCVLSMAMGVIMNYSLRKLYDLGLGALLHDIGKVRISENILNKPGALDYDELVEIHRHPVYGYEILRQHPEISALVANVAFQHHEKYNGTGYPKRIAGEQIDEYARIVAIADVYDALTANRVYKNMVLPYEAVEIIIASSGYQFEPELVKKFVQNTAIYPIGSMVELNTGEIGIVVKNNRSLPMRPTIKVITVSQGKETLDGLKIDLMVNTTVFVKKVIRFRHTILL
ncbi:MAG: HD-GYP domain-containing protein [Thermincolia bacterium]